MRLVRGVIPALRRTAAPRRYFQKWGNAPLSFRWGHNKIFGLACGRVFESLEFFPGLEAHRFSGGNADFFAGAGIAPDAGLPWLHAEYAELAQLDALPASHGVLQGLKDSLHGLLRFCAADVRLSYDCIHNIQLYHTVLPLYVARC